MKTCTINGCFNKHLAKGLCQNHYSLKRKYGRTHTIRFDEKYCKVEGCNSSHYGNGLCVKHYKRVRNHGTTDRLNAKPGSVTTTESGYLLVKKERLHRIIAEKALGKSLPQKAVVHHVDENTSNNNNKNLVICQDQAYHLLLHARTRAYIACGNANWKKCWICKQYDDPGNMVKNYHRQCNVDYCREYKQNASYQP